MPTPLERRMPQRPTARMRLATVQGVGTGVCDVTVGGRSLLGVPYVASAPTEGDVVYVFQDGASLLVLGASSVPVVTDPIDVDVSSFQFYGFEGDADLGGEISVPRQHYIDGALQLLSPNTGSASVTTEDPGGDTPPADLPDSEWPTAANTGHMGQGTINHAGDLATTVDGQIIKNLNITGRLNVLHKNVTIHHCRIWKNIQNQSGYATRIWNCTIGDPQGCAGNRNAVYKVMTDAWVQYGIGNNGNNWVRRVNLMGMCDGFRIKAGDNIRDCFIHDLFNGPDASGYDTTTHNDGMQTTTGGVMNITHNTFSAWWIKKGETAGAHWGENNAPDYATSNMMLKANSSNCTLTIEKNFFLGWGSKHIIMAPSDNGYSWINCKVITNQYDNRCRDYPTWIGTGGSAGISVTGNILVNTPPTWEGHGG